MGISTVIRISFWKILKGSLRGEESEELGVIS